MIIGAPYEKMGVIFKMSFRVPELTDVYPTHWAIMIRRLKYLTVDCFDSDRNQCVWNTKEYLAVDKEKSPAQDESTNPSLREHQGWNQGPPVRDAVPHPLPLQIFEHRFSQRVTHLLVNKDLAKILEGHLYAPPLVQQLMPSQLADREPCFLGNREKIMNISELHLIQMWNKKICRSSKSFHSFATPQGNCIDS
ncbi:hypothetical protein AVEN_32764-1 [Araneus ventricosus]|uniref:Uncharacterized protein n=1 Tax=Araneus ventricosus TaxID=182803 RepID=A0A4Y2CW96_ARAVE|nr:hypothetical protein AVEN_32764-1 [Araneus ventricosus]